MWRSVMLGRDIGTVLWLAVLFFTCLSFQGRAFAAEGGNTLENSRQPQRLVQGLLGVMKFEDDTYKVIATDGGAYEGRIPTMPFLGGMWQNSFLHGDHISLGGESGVQFGFIGKSTTLYAGGNGLHVRIKNRFFVASVPLGVNLDIHPTNKFRIYAGAGPLLMYGYLRTKNDDEASTEFESNSTNAFDLGYYGRIGADMKIGYSTRFGLQARYTDGQLDFGSNQGHLNMKGIQYMLTFTEAF